MGGAVRRGSDGRVGRSLVPPPAESARDSAAVDELGGALAPATLAGGPDCPGAAAQSLDGRADCAAAGPGAPAGAPPPTPGPALSGGAAGGRRASRRQRAGAHRAGWGPQV